MTRPGAPLIGRRAEVLAISTAVHAARAGRGGSVVLLGAPGLGTTRLAAEASAIAAAAGLVVARGRTTATLPGMPYRPVAEALLSLLRRNPGIDAAQLGAYRAVLGRLVPEWRVPEVDASSISPVLVGEGILRLCAIVGASRGCLLLMEDLDDADAETLATVEYLLDNAEDLPVALVGTLRQSNSLAAGIARAARRRGKVALLELTALPDAEVTELAAGLLGTAAEQLPPPLIEALHAVAEGSPLLVEEFLQNFTDGGQLVRTGAGWTVAGPIDRSLADSVARSIADRLTRLEEPVRQLLCTGAVIGTSFPLPVVQAVHDLSDQQALSMLAAAIRFVLPDEANPDWYRFRHPAFVETILGGLTHASRARLAGEAAEAVERLRAELGEAWLQLAATLFERAGQSDRAARYLIDAGNRALTAGAAATGVSLLDQAHALLARSDVNPARLEAVESLLNALAEVGQVDRALSVMATLDAQSGGHAIRLRADAHLRLAWAAHVSGRRAEGLDQLTRARVLLTAPDGDTDPATTRHLAATADTVAAYLNLDSASERDVAHAEVMARRAVELADQWLTEPRMGVLSCRAWHLLGIVSRERDLAESNTCFDRVRTVADQVGSTTWRLYGLVGRAGNGWLAEGDVAGLAQARDAADEVGARQLSLTCSAIIALGSVLTGELTTAEHQASAVLRESAAFDLRSTARYAAMVRAVIAANLADRQGMDTALVEMTRWGGEGSREEALALGLARVFCAFFEENRQLALKELDRIVKLRPELRTGFFLGGDIGLAPLLEQLAGAEADPSALEYAPATASGSMRWNRHFLRWAKAVALGRAGLAAEADELAAEARAAGSAFPAALHLAGRLVAESAHRDGWGDPIGWLRESEDFFQQRGVTAVASACRSQLRELGVSVYQRRAGADRVPEPLRRRGMTVREFEVLELLHNRLSNREIAIRLSISPRTVEKHVASSLLKAAVAERSDVADERWWSAVTEPRCS